MNRDGQTIIARLEALRQSARRRLFLYGLFAVLGGGLIAFLTVLALDWFLWLPPALRIIGLALFVGGFFGAIIHWVVRPLQAALSVEAIATRLEDRFAPLRDHLRSTVDFLQHEDSGSRPMMERVIRQTENELHRLPLESIFSLRPLAGRAMWLTLGVSALAIVVLAAPNWFGTGVRRYLSPLGDAEWPRTVNIEPMTGDLLVAAGDAAIVRMRVTRGWNDSLRALVHFSDSANEPGRLTLQDQGGGLFEASIDPVNADLSYWFEAGDADTLRRPSVIRVVRRPAVAEAVALIEPPPYAKRAEPKRQDLAEGPIRATVGGKVTLQVKSSKPIPEQVGKSAAGLRLATDEWVPLELDAGTYTTTWDVRENVEFRIELRDEHGFENRGAPQHFLTVVEDAAPTVTMWEPKSQLELTPKGSLRLVARVDDDFGLDSVTLSAEKSPSDEQFLWSLTDRLRPFDSENGVAFVVEHTLPMGTMNAASGDSITYYLTATDNRAMDELSPQMGRGPSMRVRIISEVEFEIRLRDDVAMLETKLRQVMVDQSELADRTSTFVQNDELATNLTAAERDTVSSTAAAQSRLGRRLGEVAKRFRELAERVEANQPGDKETAGQLAALGGSMLQLANGGMANAGEALQDASERPTSEEQQKQLRIARQKQELAVSQLQASIRSMSQWGNFQGLVTRTRDLMERQDALRNRTTDLGQKTLGKSVQDLAPAEAAALKRLQRQQEQLAGDVEQLLDRMNQLQAASKEKDPASAESIDAALRAAAARDVTTHARQAVDALSSNRTAAASIEQKAALDALNKMASVLQEREARELAQLRKRIDKAEEQVAQLLREQEALRKATKEAGDVAADANALTILEQEQHALRRNTGAVGESIGELAVASSVVRLIRQSVNPMTRAEQGLRERAIPDALVHQDEAIKSLAEALEILHELAEQSAREEMRRTLTQIRENLEAMAAAQKAVNDGLATVRAAIDGQQGRIGRAEAREVTRLARAQASVREMCETLRPDFEQVMVYRWAMDRVATWMDDARTAFDSRSVDGRLSEITRRILRELERLAAAVLDTEKLPLDSEFVEAQSGDGGSGPTEQQNVPVPPMTELLVIKSLQVELLARTKAMSDLVAGGAANEAQLRELKRLGEDQAELRRLTEIVTRQSRGR